MGGEGQYVRFDPAYRSASWVSRTGLTPLNDEELEAAYPRAKDFLMDKKRELVDVYGWSVQPEEDGTLFVITGQCGGDEVRLSLPLHFTSFIGEAKGTWQKMFEHGCFNAARRHGSNTTLFIDSPGPVADIFYLLQILAPGMLLIVRVDERNDGDENETTRVLPSEEWLKEHQSVLGDVLDNNQTFELLSSAAADFAKSFRQETIYVPEPSWKEDARCCLDDDDDNIWMDDDNYYTTAWGSRSAKDYTACDSDCGFCGRCEY